MVFGHMQYYILKSSFCLVPYKHMIPMKSSNSFTLLPSKQSISKYCQV